MINEIAKWCVNVGLKETGSDFYCIDFLEAAKEFNVSVDFIDKHAEEINEIIYNSDKILCSEIDGNKKEGFYFDMIFEPEEICKTCSEYKRRCKINCFDCDNWSDNMEKSKKMKRKVSLSYTVELVVEADSEEAINDWLACTTPMEVKKKMRYKHSDSYKEYYGEHIVSEVNDDEPADYVID